MSLPVLGWLSRPLARLLRWTWMGRLPLWPVGQQGAFAGLPRRGKKRPPRPDVKLSLEMMEQRWVPQDMLGVIRSGTNAVGVSVIGSLLLGHNVDQPSLLAAPAPGVGSSTTQPDVSHDNAADRESSAFLSVVAAPQQAADSAATTPAPPPAQPIQPTSGDSGMSDWLQQVGNFLSGQSPALQTPTPNEPSTNSGGGDGPGSPGAGLNTSQPAAPMPATPSNVSNANAAAPMAQAAAAMNVQAAAAPLAPVAATTTGAGGVQGSATTSQASTAQTATPQAIAAPTPAFASNFGQVPLSFELNMGQTDPSVLALSHGPGFGFWLTHSGMTFSVPHVVAQTGQSNGRDVFTLALAGANTSGAQVVPGDLQAGRSNYFIGSDSGQWLSNMPQYGQITYQNIYSGIDLILHSASGEGRTLEYDFLVHTGASAASIQINPQGLQGVSMDGQGNILLATSGGNVVMAEPLLYQTIYGQRRDVSGKYVLEPNGMIGLQVTGSYDASLPLVLDPTVQFSSYLGGTGDDFAYGVAVDAYGNSYLTGKTSSTNFPTQNGYQDSASSSFPNVFVTKLNAQGTGIIWSTYLGGTGVSGSIGNAIAVDLSGDVYVVGQSTSGFPVTTGSYQTTFTGTNHDGFITKLNATGDELVYSTYYNSDAMSINAVAVDPEGQAHIAGTVTNGTTLTTTSGVVQSSFGGGTSDAFVTEMNAAGSTQVYATYLGGSGTDSANGIALDSADNAYVVGTTGSSNFPTSTGAYQTSLTGGLGVTNAFVSKLNSTATTLTYSTYIGTTTTTGTAIALDRSNQAYITGTTGSHVLVDALNAAGTTLVYGTTLSGNGTDNGNGIAVTATGTATVVGSTTSTNFPTTSGAFQTSLQGTQSAFVAQLTASGTQSYGSYLGGSTGGGGLGGTTTTASSVALTPLGAASVAGSTNATNFPTAGGAYQSSNAGGNDAFITQFLPGAVPPLITAISPDTGSSSSDQITNSQKLTISGTATPSTTVTLERADLGVLGSVPVSSGGTWSYDYTGATLPENSYDFIARDVKASGVKSAYSPDFLVTVDETAPTVALGVPASMNTTGPVVRVTAKDLVGMPATATVTLDLSTTSSSGPWTNGYASGTLAGGAATITLDLAGTGNYWLRARASDLAGNQGTSAVSSFTVNPVASWTGSAQALSADPLEGDAEMQMGAVQFSHALDLDQSPGTSQGGEPALAFNSDEVSQKPIVQLQLNSPNNALLPSTISAQLTFNGTAASTVTYSTTGLAAGDTLTMALQASTAITTTGGYSWSVNVTAGSFTHTYTGYTFVVAQDSSPFGAGWSFASVNQLVSISASGSVPAGMLMVFGTGGWRFYQGSGSYTSPVGDNGTLTVLGGTYTYSTPDGQSWTYNSSGLMTQWTSADGQETLQYRYDGSSRLTGITAIDGALTSITYTGTNTVTFQTVNNRVTTLTLSSGNLASITNADGGVQTLSYDSSHRLTQQQLGLLEDVWSYNSAGVLSTMTQGGPTLPGNSPSNTSYFPALTQGLNALVAGTVQAIAINPDNAQVIEQLDTQGRMLSTTAGDAGIMTLTYGNGFLSGETDPLGRTATYSLDSSGYVTKATLPDGSVVTYQYQSAFHALTTMVDERGNTTTYAYDSTGHLTGTTDALGHHSTYGYLGDGLLQTATDANSHTVTYSYDTDRRLSTITEPTGATTTISYDANGNVHTVKDALLRVTTVSYDLMDRLTSTVNAVGGQQTMTYDISGLELTATDEMGVETQYVYDSYNRGLVVQTIVGVGSSVPVTSLNTYDAAERLISVRDSIGGTTNYSYDPAGNVTAVTDALNHTTQLDYDLAAQQTAMRSPMGNWSQYSYNARSWLTQVQDPLGNLSTIAYDSAGNVTAVTDQLNHTSTYSYDALNRETVAQDPLGLLVTTSYDSVGNVTSAVNANGVTTSYAYDADNRLTSESDAVGTSVQRTLSTGYNSVGDATTVTDGNSHVTTLAYDALDRVTSATDPLSHINTISYDAASAVTAVTNALSHTGTITNDVLHRPVAATDPLSHTGTVVLDNAGDTAATVDPLGNVSAAMIDPLGQTVGGVDALGNVTQTVLDPEGNPRMVVDPDGNETHYVRDRLGRVLETITPIGTTTMAYDAAGRATSTTDANGRLIQYSYDNDDRLTGEVWKSAAGVTLNVLTYTWDNDGNLRIAANSAGTEAYSYDSLDRVQSYTNVFGQVLTYSYDANDNITQRTDSLGGTLTYVYDNANRLTSEQFSGTGATGTVIRVDFGYDAANRQTTITWFSNLAGTATVAYSAYSYDNANRLTSIVNSNSANATLSYYNYSYDNADRVSTQTRWSQVGTTVYSGTNTYTYDAASQLLSDGSSYSYDANGNRTMSGYTTGSDNEMSSDGTYTYSYDAEGNLTSKTTGSGSSQVTWTYSYDNANELTGVVETGSSGTLAQLTYTFDAEGHRVGEQVWTSGSGVTTTMRYAIDAVNGGNTWADLDGSNNLLVRYEWGPGIDQILTRTVASGGNAGAWAYLTDEQGSVRDLVNWSGAVQDHLDYTGYGVVTESNPTVGSRYQYDAYQYEATTGLDYVNARWYNPTTGTWQTQDPLGFAGGLANLRQYVGNNPTNLSDPTGLGGPNGGPGYYGGNQDNQGDPSTYGFGQDTAWAKLRGNDGNRKLIYSGGLGDSGVITLADTKTGKSKSDWRFERAGDWAITKSADGSEIYLYNTKTHVLMYRRYDSAPVTIVPFGSSPRMVIYHDLGNGWRTWEYQGQTYFEAPRGWRPPPFRLRRDDMKSDPPRSVSPWNDPPPKAELGRPIPMPPPATLGPPIAMGSGRPWQPLGLAPFPGSRDPLTLGREPTDIDRLLRYLYLRRLPYDPGYVPPGTKVPKPGLDAGKTPFNEIEVSPLGGGWYWWSADPYGGERGPAGGASGLGINPFDPPSLPRLRDFPKWLDDVTH
jgi:RHS repeat-associated protein